LRPTGNVTGIAVDLGPDFYSKQLDLLLQAAPKASHVAFLSAEAVYRVMRQLWREANLRGVRIQEFLCTADYETVPFPFAWAGVGLEFG
jgi:putative tryptophan/tyrosine transport system substrate-binding protein